MRYSPISEFYKNRFGHKVQKVPVSLATDCPNRMGLKGMQTCIFCDEWGSAAYPEQQELDLKSQIEKYKPNLEKQYKATGFLAYFQAYTSTFLGVKTLRESFETVLSVPGFLGIIIGTRPDCISPALLNLWKEYSKKTFLSVELGLQTFSEDKLRFLRRGHSNQVSIATIEKMKNEIPELDLGIHLIFGLPDETDAEILSAAATVSALGINHVKLHNLHVLKNTPLEKMYFEKKFSPISLEEYTRRVILFLQYLDPKVYVQRLGALSSRWEELIAPEWTKHKMRTYQYILDEMEFLDVRQGQFYQ
jgi:radical SAM protein (TIGR01212 family)